MHWAEKDTFMKARWCRLAMVAVLVGATLGLAACQNRPGYNAYGRYPTGTMEPSKSATSDTDWYKDIGN
jgi:hypothetical protein